MKITALLENTARRADMQTEHGLSLYIETENLNVLFDMGQSANFAENAKTLGIDLKKIDVAVLSHGHYDHGGGLAEFLKINSHAPVLIHRDAFLPHYNGTEKYIGLDLALANHPRIIYTDDIYKLSSSVSLFSCNEKTRKHRFGSFGLTEKVGKRYIEDDFRHEQYLLVEEKGKRILFSGCSHKGIEDIVSWFTPDVLIGGFHFSKMPLDENLKQIAKRLNAYPTEFYTCHCTGEMQFLFMKEEMHRLHYLSCGETIII
ncbi:MAG: MBL fold metallo-hydrolase [Ruminococcaceae bacterium]|nr:MBL fold metallo-hydrolase [Oscillospiraceae bacterium]